jgi:hypothetical protein
MSVKLIFGSKVRTQTEGVLSTGGLNRTVGSKRQEVTGLWRKIHNEELYNLYFLPNIIRMITSRRMR